MALGIYSLYLALQIFGQQQTFNQSLLGTGQQNFQAINNQMNTINQNQQYTVQVGQVFCCLLIFMYSKTCVKRPSHK